MDAGDAIQFINQADEQVLLNLNKRICSRLDQFQRRKLANYCIGQHVEANIGSRGRTVWVEAVIDKITAKKIHITTKTGQKWSMSPCYVRNA